MRDWTRIAQIIKPKNTKGCLVVRSTAGLPFLLTEGMDIAFVPPQFDCPRSARVLSISPGKNDDYLVYFSKIETYDIAEKLAGGFCLVRRNCLPDDFESLREEDIVGYSVTDQKRGELGTVLDFVEHPLQSQLIVAGSYGEFIIPFVDEFVLSIDDVKKIITVQVTQGILDLAICTDESMGVNNVTSDEGSMS